MTKFNQQRRLEDRHIAEKHHVVKSPRKGPPARTAVARASHASSTSHSPPSHSRGSPGFDVISSKIPRQQRTHAIYRRDSDPSSSAGPSPHRQQAVKSPSPNRHSTAGQPARAQRPMGSNNDICEQSSLDSANQQVQQLFKPKPRRSPHAQARASAQLMLQANAVLQELDHSLLQAAEAASAEVAAAAARPAPQHDSTAALTPPVSSSPRAVSPRLPAVPRVASSASPRVRVQSQQQGFGRLGLGSSTPPGPSPPPQPLQHRSFSMPTQQLAPAPQRVHTLSHALAQLRQAPLDRATSNDNRDKQEQQQQPEQLAQRLTTKSLPLLSKAEPPATQPSLAAQHTMPDAASEPVSDADELSQRHAERSKGVASPERSETGFSHMSQGRSMQGPSGNQPHLPNLATVPLEESGSQAAVKPAETDSMEIKRRSGSLSKESLLGVALPNVLQPFDQSAKAGHAGTPLKPAASDTAAMAEALSEASGRSSPRAMSSPPGALPHNALPCSALPHAASPFPALPFAALPFLALPCPAVPWPMLPRPSLPCPSRPCPALPCPSRFCPALPCLALPCPALPCPALPCPGLLALLCKVPYLHDFTNTSMNENTVVA